MQEAVIFPKPEEVNIIATRNGELTNIKGTEFRAPLAPFKTQFRFNAGSSSGPIIYTDTDTTAIPIVLFKGVPNRAGEISWEAFATCFNAYETTLVSDQDATHKTAFEAQLVKSSATPPDSDEEIGLIVQLIGNKTTQYIDDTADSSGTFSDVILLPSYSQRVFVTAQNGIDPSFYKPYGA